VKPTLLDRIREAQKGDSEMEEIKENISKGKTEGFCEDEKGTLWSETHSNYVVCVDPVETRPQIASTS
jgi:sugar lactone lactonase YvrE